MKRFLHLLWLIPAYFFFLSFYELSVWRGLSATVENGEDIVAEIVYFKLKNMQAQSNGVIEIRMKTSSGAIVDQKMTLPVQLAAQLRPLPNLPVKYLEGSKNPVAIMPTIRFHLRMILINMAITFSSAIVMSVVCYYASRYAERSRYATDPVYVVE